MPLSRGELGPRLTQCGLEQVLLQYQVVSSSIQPFGHNRHGPKTGGCAPAMSSNTTAPWPRFTSVPSGIMIHPAAWPKQTSAENWGTVLTVWPIHQRHRRTDRTGQTKVRWDKANRFTNGRPKVDSLVLTMHRTLLIDWLTYVLSIL